MAASSLAPALTILPVNQGGGSEAPFTFAVLAALVLVAAAVLLLLAIRYEKRIKNLKDAVGRIAALR